MTDTTHGIAGRSLAEWRDFAREDYCLDCMVPSDLRHVLGALTDLQAERDAWKARAEAAEAVVRFGVDLIEGDSFGSEWKKGCADFRRKARALTPRADLAKGVADV